MVKFYVLESSQEIDLEPGFQWYIQALPFNDICILYVRPTTSTRTEAFKVAVSKDKNFLLEYLGKIQKSVNDGYKLEKNQEMAELEEIKERIKELENALYYMPPTQNGGPGFAEAKEEYEKQSENSYKFNIYKYDDKKYEAFL